jgi:hypothetical protein
VQIDNNITLAENGASSSTIAFNSTVDSKPATYRTLTINTGLGTGDGWQGSILFNGKVGSLRPLAALNVNPLLSATVSAAGSLAFENDVTINGLAKMYLTGGTITGTLGNHFGSIALRAAEVTINEADATVLASSNVSQNLSITSGGTISENGALIVGGTASPGTASFVTQNNGNITLSLTSNHVYGSVFLSSGTGNATLANGNALLLVSTTVGGNLTVSTSGSIGQLGALVVGGTAAFRSPNYNIRLEDTANRFGVLSLTGKNVSVYENDSTLLGASTITGVLALSSGGNIAQTGSTTALTVTGTAAFKSDGDITLDRVKNHLVNSVLFSGLTGAGAGNVVLVNNTSIKLGSSSIGGNLALTATTSTSSITQTGTASLSVSGTFSATATGSITLTNSNNAFATIGGVARGGLFSLRDQGGGLTLAGAITLLGASTTADVLLVTTGGNLVMNVPGYGAAIKGRNITISTDYNVINEGDNTLQAGGFWRVYTLNKYGSTNYDHFVKGWLRNPDASYVLDSQGHQIPAINGVEEWNIPPLNTTLIEHKTSNAILYNSGP